MFPAQFFESAGNGKVRCLLCPHECLIAEGKTGICKARKNQNGKLRTLVYNKVAALHSDPIEKKPLYHFYPGKMILSIGEAGCNFNCPFCQNHHISQASPEDYNNFSYINPDLLAEQASKIPGNIGVAYTYNEPVIFYEFMSDCAVAVKNSGLKNVVVSNGFINPEPLKRLLPFIDAFNIDLKAFSENFYQKQAGGKLQPVLETLKTIVKSGKHLEVTNLVIPGLNDDSEEFKSMVKWIKTELGSDVPLHLSRYFPAYHADYPPTPLSILENLFLLASEYLNFVYIGNIGETDYSATICPSCKKTIIKRNRYDIWITSLQEKINCGYCGRKIVAENQ